jgi:hypothetical protein
MIIPDFGITLAKLEAAGSFSSSLFFFQKQLLCGK